MASARKPRPKIERGSMLFLSLSRPWTWAIFDTVANKGIENRSWPPPISAIGQRIGVHAAKSWDDDAIRMFIGMGLTGFPNRKDLYPSGFIIGVATIDRVVTEARTLPPAQARWFFEPTPEDPNYGWILTDRTPLRSPVACAGEQGLRRMPLVVERLVLEQLRGAA